MDFKIHASKAGELMTDKKGSVFTTNEKEELTGLLEKENIFKSGLLPPRQRWTQNMIDRKKELIDKRDRPFELSDTAKGMLNEHWLWYEKGIPTIINSKYTDKGKWAEEDAITLLSQIDGKFYRKNEERKEDDNFTGECDINNKKIIQDVKSSWDALTFMNAELTPLYEWQGRVYMELWGADEFWLRYCLVDCPDHILVGEKIRFLRSNGIDPDEGGEELERLLTFMERKLIYSTNEKINPEERVKTFKIYRDDERFKEIVERIPYAREYYKSIRLNQI